MMQIAGASVTEARMWQMQEKGSTHFGGGFRRCTKSRVPSKLKAQSFHPRFFASLSKVFFSHVIGLSAATLGLIELIG